MSSHGKQFYIHTSSKFDLICQLCNLDTTVKAPHKGSCSVRDLMKDLRNKVRLSFKYYCYFVELVNDFKNWCGRPQLLPTPPQKSIVMH